MAFTREDAEKKCVTLGKNGLYLEVKWRAVWYRENCPNGTIETEMIHLDLDRETEEEVTEWEWSEKANKKVPVKKIKKAFGLAIFKATITDGEGGKATATKSEKAASFPDFIEKAETGAIGRALALLGYGTQFTGDELAERHRIVDAPVKEDDHEQTPSAPAKPAQQTTNVAPRPQQARTQPVLAKTAEQKPVQNVSNGNAPRSVPLATIKLMAAKYYSDGMEGLRKALVEKFKVIGELTDEMIEKDYNSDAQAMIHQMANEQRRLASAGATSGK